MEPLGHELPFLAGNICCEATAELEVAANSAADTEIAKRIKDKSNCSASIQTYQIIGQFRCWQYFLIRAKFVDSDRLVL